MHRPHITALLPLLLVPVASAAGSLDCKNIRVDDVGFDLSKLGGPHSVVTSRWESSAETHTNTTYTLDICKPLKRSGNVKKNQECPNGTKVCAIQRVLHEKEDFVDKVVAIAGSLENVGGTAFDYEATRLKSSDSNSDSEKEGLRLVFKGGKHPLNGPVKERRSQKAILEFICDHDKTGLEGEWRSEDRYEGDDKKLRRREDKDENKDEDDGVESGVEHQLKKDDAALIWGSYKSDGDEDILRMTWNTKYACETSKGGGDKGGGEDGPVNPSWGFFTWFVIIAFLGIAAYLIFGSWLNYNRYGARGWDLLPHGDAIRDIPYLLKDWTRSALNTVQGTGNRGGYSAV